MEKDSSANILRDSFDFILNTDPVESDQKSDTELHMLISNDHVKRSLCSIKSLFMYVKNLCVVIHDDGTLSNNDCEVISRHILGVRICRKEDSDIKAESLLGKYPLLKKRREENIFIKKLTDIIFSSRTGKIISLDSDILCLKHPQAISEWINSSDKYNLLGSEYPYVSFQDKSISSKKYKMIKNLNAGMICYHADFIDFELAETILSDKDFAINHHRGFDDQSFLSMNFGELNSKNPDIVKRLDSNLYVNNHQVSRDSIMKHYWASKFNPSAANAYLKDIECVKDKMIPTCEIGVLFLYHKWDEATEANYRSLKENNPNALTVCICTWGYAKDGHYRSEDLIEDFPNLRSSLFGESDNPEKEKIWWNADMPIYLWYVQKKEKAKRWVVCEWDVLINDSLENIYKDVWESDVACANKMNRDDEWYWFKEKRGHLNLPEQYEKYLSGTMPLAGVMFSDESLSKIAKKALTDKVFQSLFCELRVGVLSKVLNLEINEISADAKLTLHGKRILPRKKVNKKGIWHKIKSA